MEVAHHGRSWPEWRWRDMRKSATRYAEPILATLTPPDVEASARRAARQAVSGYTVRKNCLVPTVHLILLGGLYDGKCTTPARITEPVNRTVTPRRRKNAELRTREHLTSSEVESLMKAAKGNRYGHRDATMILIGYRPAGSRTVHPALTRSPASSLGPYASYSVRPGLPSCSCRRVGRRSPPPGLPDAERAAEVAGIEIKVHPHMLRHACGFALANRGHDTRSLQAYLGHKNIQHTVRYTEMAPDRFKGFWRD